MINDLINRHIREGKVKLPPIDDHVKYEGNIKKYVKELYVHWKTQNTKVFLYRHKKDVTAFINEARKHGKEKEILGNINTQLGVKFNSLSQIEEIGNVFHRDEEIEKTGIKQDFFMVIGGGVVIGHIVNMILPASMGIVNIKGLVVLMIMIAIARVWSLERKEDVPLYRFTDTFWDRTVSGRF